MNDDELRARMQAADPARDLTDVPRLEIPEAEMHTDRSTRPTVGRLVLAAAALVVLVLAGVGLATGQFRGDGKDTRAQPRPGPTETPTQTTEPTTATFALPSSAAPARCAPPTTQGVRQLDVAFLGTVQAVSDGQVTLEPTQVWRGQQVRRVVLEHDAAGAHRELLPVRFREGADYVVSVKDGVVQLCGYTAPARADLEQLFTDALG